MPTELTLYGSTTSPFVRKVRMALLAKAMPHAFVVRSAWNPDNRIEDLTPLAKVPVLVVPGRPPLHDSGVIFQYLDAAQPEPALFPTDPMARIDALQHEALADGIAEATALWVQEGWRPAERRSAIWRQRQADKVERGLAALEARWAARASAQGGRGAVDGRGLRSAEALASAAATGFVGLWLPELRARVAMPAWTALEAELASKPWFRETVPALAPGAPFPAL